MGLGDVIRASRARVSVARREPIAVANRRVLLAYLFPGLGDNVLLLPVLEALASREPAMIGVLVRSVGARVLERYGRSVRVHVLPDELIDRTRTDHPTASRLRSARGTAVRAARTRLSKELRGSQYDVAVDLTHRREVDTRGILARSGAASRVGLIAPGESLGEAGLLAGVVDERHLPSQHWSRHVVEGLGPLGIDAPRYGVPISIPARARARAKGPAEGPRVLLVPGSQFAEKRWPIEHWEALAGELITRDRAQVVVTGAPFEVRAIRAFARRVGARAFTGADLAQLLAFIEQADVVVGNDTGPMHFAYLLGRPAVTLFLHMSPTIWGPPVSDPRFVAFEVDASTRPEQVLEAVRGRFTQGIGSPVRA
ncbi:MAG: glycosyltransferase family 9 protein [Deltaproteobacteria bacterium]|nr:glycosyltransferase family 9 protein [Deltaproteobacteria bacterium]